MSVEGMWAIYFGDIASSAAVVNSGVIVLETEKLFGGDSLMAYLGSYQTTGTLLRASARTWNYNPAHGGITNAFGRSGNVDIVIEFEGTMDSENLIRGYVWEDVAPNIRLPAQLRRIADLP